MKLSRFLILPLFLLSSLASASNGILTGWTEDYPAALKQAAAEKKDVLIYFSGSDWCTWCHKLTAEILDTEHFKSEAPKQFVLVQADFPRDTEQPAELKKQNTELRKKYKVRGFPTLVLADAKGTLYLTNGYREQTPEDYVSWLRQAPIIRDVDALVAVEKWEAALEKIDAFKKSENPIADILQQALIARARIFERLGKSKDEIILALEDAVAADPESSVAEQLKKIIEEIKEEQLPN